MGDSMLSGFAISEDDADEITVEHYRLLNKLMKKQSSIQSSRNLFGGISPKQDEDEALNKEYNRVMFDLYCEKRQTIILQMDNVMSQFKKLSRLVICERIPNL